MIRRTRPALGTFIEITVSQNSNSACINKAFDKIDEIEKILSFFLPESDIAKINRLPRNVPLKVNAHTYTVLSFTQELALLTNGLFDVTVGSILMAEGFLPSNFTVQTGNWKDITLLEDYTINLSQELCIDLGGIAKGYAVDCAIQTLIESGATEGSVNAGGDLRVFGEDAEPLHIRHPITPEQTVYLGDILLNNAVATSAGYYSRKNDYLPIVNPITQIYSESNDSVSIIANSCMIADALTKLFLLDPHNVSPLLKHYQARAILLRQDSLSHSLHIFDSNTLK